MKERVRYRCVVRGRVQGVGFRPFVYRLATRLSLGGWVRNGHAGVVIEVEGSETTIESLVVVLRTTAPQGAIIDSIHLESICPQGTNAFVIDTSTCELFDRMTIPVDTAPCSTCLAELFDPNNRRHRYPFISCASCGPRFSILKRLPFDRDNTTLDEFPLCAQCRREYSSPDNRRFHAQTIGCFECGPTVWLTDRDGQRVSTGDDAITDAADAIRAGEVVAVKGVGGFHLLVDAISDAGVRLLRRGKERGNKPFGLMYRTINDVCKDCVVSDVERRLLLDYRAPMVFLARRPLSKLSESVAPGSPYLGAMLPCSPLHHLLMEKVRWPVVATSGNRSGEPICRDNAEALRQLREVASRFLLHNRSISNPCDDSILQVLAGRDFPRRMGRGYAPYPISLPTKQAHYAVAMGGATKSAVAISGQAGTMVGPYGGAVDSVEVLRRHEAIIALVSSESSRMRADTIVDLHPDVAPPRGEAHRTFRVQHHLAHAWSAIVDGAIDLPVCAVVWDGAGYGPDGTIWGGEWLIVTEQGYERRYHLRPFLLIGGDKAAFLPERSAAALWFGTFGERASRSKVWERLEARDALWQMVQTKVGCTLTTSMGRLFDAIASALGVCQVNTFEGEAAMRLEALAHTAHGAPYPLSVGDSAALDWAPLIEAVAVELDRGVSAAVIARSFHETLIHLIGETARQIGIARVLLTGGCFQNSLLLEGAIHTLRERGFSPHWHQHIPCSDEGLSVGQMAAVLAYNRIGRGSCA